MTDIFTQNIAEVSLTYKNKAKANERPRVKRSQDAYQLFRDNWDDLTINLFEEFKILLLDNSNSCLGISTISKGGMTGTVVDPRIIFSIALKARANAIVLAHNHPSQTLKPSNADIQVTKKLFEGGKLLDIKVLDHLIITEHAYCSFADKGVHPF